MAAGHITRGSAKRLAGYDGSAQPSQRPGDTDDQRVRGAHDLYAQAEAARKQSQGLAGQLHATQHKASETWQHIGAAWNRTEEIRVRWLAGQLAKILYVPGRSGALAKSEQILLGVKLALSYPKSEILQMYSSVAYFGHGYYGLQAASCGYFAVAPAALTWPQAALLAGLAQAPTADDPLTHLSLARAREAHVLGRLAAMGKLTQAQAGAAYQRPLHLSDGHTSRCAARSAAK